MNDPLGAVSEQKPVATDAQAPQKAKRKLENPYGAGGKAGALARTHLEKSINVLAEVSVSRTAPDAARVDAAVSLIKLGKNQL